MVYNIRIKTLIGNKNKTLKRSVTERVLPVTSKFVCTSLKPVFIFTSVDFRKVGNLRTVYWRRKDRGFDSNLQFLLIF